MTVKEKINIRAAAPRVWDMIANIQQYAGSIKAILQIEILEQAEGELKGLRWRETRKYFGKPASVDKWIVDAVKNRSYTAKSTSDGFIFLTSMEIVETVDGVTLTSLHDTIPIGSIAPIKSLFMFFFKPMLKKAIRKDLQDIKVAIEQKNAP